MLRTSPILDRVERNVVPKQKRRKRLYGEACNVVRTVLATEVEVMSGVGLDEIQETEQTQPSSPPIFVCKSCETKLQNIADIQNQVVQQKHELQSYLTSLHPLSREEPSTSSVGQKRSIHSTSPTSLPSVFAWSPLLGEAKSVLLLIRVVLRHLQVFLLV